MKNLLFILSIFSGLACIRVLAQPALYANTPNELFSFSTILAEEKLPIFSREYLASVPIDGYLSRRELPSEMAFLELTQTLASTQVSAEKLVSRFALDYPAYPGKTDLQIQVATQKYSLGKHDSSLQELSRIRKQVLSKEQQYQVAILEVLNSFYLTQYDKAEEALYTAKAVENNPLVTSYYEALLAFQKGQWENSISAFDRYKDQYPVGSWEEYYAYALYNTGNFARFLQFGESATLPIETKQTVEELKAISHFMTGQPEVALEVFEQQMPQSAEGIYIYAKSISDSNPEKALTILKTMDTHQSNTHSYYGHYLAARLSLDKNDYDAAKRHLEHVVRSEVKTDVSEIAHFQYIQLCYNTNDIFENVEEVIYSFNSSYPSSIYRGQVFNILIQYFVKKKEYQKAIALLEQYGMNNAKLKLLYQKIALYQGLKEYNKEAYGEAYSLLEKSMQRPISTPLMAKSSYWHALSAYKLGLKESGYKALQRTEEIYGSMTQIHEMHQATYFLGVMALEQAEYSSAIGYLTRFIQRTEATLPYRVDATLKIADAQMVIRDFESAKENFRRASTIEGDHRDYAALNESICHNLLGNHEEEIRILTNFDQMFPTSAYKESALFRLADALLASGNLPSAKNKMESFVLRYPSSENRSVAQLKIAQIDFAQRNYEASKSTLKNALAAGSLDQEEQEQAIGLLKNIYYSLGDARGYVNYITEYPQYEFGTESNTESFAYNAGFKSYKDRKYTQAVESLQYYLSQYPKGKYRTMAQYYLGESLLETGALASAKQAFLASNTTNNSRKEETLERLAVLNYNEGNYAEAYPFFTALTSIASTKKTQHKAEMGVLRTGYTLKKYTETTQLASKLLEKTDLSNADKEEVKFLLGASAYHRGSLDLAKKELAYFIRKEAFPKCSQANYYTIDILFQQKKFDAVINFFTEQLDFIENDKYLGKSILRFAQAHSELGDIRSALQLYDAIPEKIEDPEVRKQALELKHTLEQP